MAVDTTVTVARPAAGPALQLPELTGDREQVHWGEQVRADRLREVTDAARRAWMAKTWTRAKLWVDTREVPVATLLQRTQAQYDEYRRKTAEEQKARAAEAQQKAAAVAAYQAMLQKAGITEAGLIELVDASERADPAVAGRKTRRTQRHRPPPADFRHRRSERAAGQGKEPQGQFRLRHRARRGAGRRSEAVHAGAVTRFPTAPASPPQRRLSIPKRSPVAGWCVRRVLPHNGHPLDCPVRSVERRTPRQGRGSGSPG